MHFLFLLQNPHCVYFPLFKSTGLAESALLAWVLFGTVQLVFANPNHESLKMCCSFKERRIGQSAFVVFSGLGLGWVGNRRRCWHCESAAQ